MKSSAKAAVQTEVDAHFLYMQLASAEPHAAVAKIYRQMADIELEHAQAMLQHSGSGLKLPAPSWRARVLNRIGKIAGYEYVLSSLVETEKAVAFGQTEVKKTKQVPLSGKETNHVKILEALVASQSQLKGENVARLEGRRHKSVGGNALRAAVLGANDGLVSNMSLVMGVAGATSGGAGVLLAGMAGLLAGALSMALGEWISVKSSQELYERQMAIEMLEIETNPEAEQKELQLIYMAKGLPEEQAATIAASTMANPAHAHEVLTQEELGIQVSELKSSAWTAAITSFILFAVGAIIPVVPFLITTGSNAVIWSLLCSAVGLFLIGAAITLFTGRSIWYSGLRQVLFGLAAAAITFGIGKWIGVSLEG